MSLDKRTSKTASYPVAQGYRPPPLERKSSPPGWAFPVALGVLAAFLVAGVVLLIQCLGSEPEASSADAELPAKSAHVAPNTSVFKPGVEPQTAPPLVHEASPAPKQQSVTITPNQQPAQPVPGQQAKADPPRTF